MSPTIRLIMQAGMIAGLLTMSGVARAEGQPERPPAPSPTEPAKVGESNGQQAPTDSVPAQPGGDTDKPKPREAVPDAEVERIIGDLERAAAGRDKAAVAPSNGGAEAPK
ncbi:MAG: hypothetical protein H7Y88_09655, partial [Phycisphaerales bacterium]|nr:hypothetical protein [Phycisphaerales bacterium]